MFARTFLKLKCIKALCLLRFSNINKNAGMSYDVALTECYSLWLHVSKGIFCENYSGHPHALIYICWIWNNILSYPQCCSHISCLCVSITSCTFSLAVAVSLFAPMYILNMDNSGVSSSLRSLLNVELNSWNCMVENSRLPLEEFLSAGNVLLWWRGSDVIYFGWKEGFPTWVPYIDL